MEPIIIFDDDQEQAAHAAASQQQSVPESTPPAKRQRRVNRTAASRNSAESPSAKSRPARSRKKDTDSTREAANDATGTTNDMPETENAPKTKSRRSRASKSNPAALTEPSASTAEALLSSSAEDGGADSASEKKSSRARRTSPRKKPDPAADSKTGRPQMQLPDVPDSAPSDNQEHSSVSSAADAQQTGQPAMADSQTGVEQPADKKSSSRRTRTRKAAAAMQPGNKEAAEEASAVKTKTAPRLRRARPTQDTPSDSSTDTHLAQSATPPASKTEESPSAPIQSHAPDTAMADRVSASETEPQLRPATIDPFPFLVPTLRPPVLPAVHIAAPPAVTAQKEPPVEQEFPSEVSVSDTEAPSDQPAHDTDDDSQASTQRRRRGHRGGRGRRKRQVAQQIADESSEQQPGTGESHGGADTPSNAVQHAELIDSDRDAATPAEPEAEEHVNAPAAIPSDAGQQDSTAVNTLNNIQSLSENDDRQPRSRSRSARRRAAAARRKAEAKAAAENAANAGEHSTENEENEHSGNATKNAGRIMLVSVLPGELVEVVILENGIVAEYYVEMVHQAKIRGNIYKGVVSNIDPNLQAAFINFGQAKNGFLQIDEVHPEYWLTHYDPEKGAKYPPIQKVMKAGQEVLVQVVKEPSGSKGAFLTTWVSLPGRFLVLTPGQEQIGISRKVEDGEERNRLRELIKDLKPGEGVGAIVRTVSAGTSKTTLQRDLSYLKRVWKGIHKRAGTEKSPSMLYEEPGLASRAVRDYLSDDVTEIWVDDQATADTMREMVTMLFPRRAEMVKLYDNPTKTLWEQFNVRKQLEQVHSREVTLPSGGRLVFDQTEALMAIDINSGKSGGKTNFEATAVRTNMEAAEAIARQLRLRDVGGQVVIDFIEMRDQSKGREVEKVLHNAMKNDRARHDIGHMSSFGLLQIVRQRIGSSAISLSLEPCPHCGGTGMRRNLEWQALQLLRELRGQMNTAARNGHEAHICTLEPELAVYILNAKRERLTALEKEFGVRLEIRVSSLGESH